MRRLNIFISSRKDVRKERALTERLIRSVAAEFNLPVSASYSNWLRPSYTDCEVAAQGTTRSFQEGPFLLCPRFWEYQDSDSEDTFREHPLNTGQYNLVICLLWSRLGVKPVPPYAMPDGGEPRSATHYEIAWALNQANRTPGVPALQVYRNRSTLAAALEPREVREAALEHWDSLQEIFGDKKKNTVFAEACHDYRDLGEFEVLFRHHFRDYIVTRLGQEFSFEVSAQRVRKITPFRGLDFFDYEHAPFFYGRTKIVGEILDILEQQAVAKKQFLLLLGPRGSGKTSLVRAGVLPVLTQVGTLQGDGTWRHALTRPAAGGKGPFDALAAALLSESALPECPSAKNVNGWENLAADLRKQPEHVALLLCETLDRLSLKPLNRVLDTQEYKSALAEGKPGVGLSRQNKLARVRSKVQLALVVDQLEELFAGGISPELQQSYLAALAALVRCQRIFVIATLQSDFYDCFLRSCYLDKFAVLSGRFELPPPTAVEIGQIIHWPSEAIGLQFEAHPKTGQKLDEAVLEAATVNAEALPLVEHLLSQLYQKQVPRGDGLLRWSDYLELGKLEGALACHAENVFLALDKDAQDALAYVMRQLVSPGQGRESIFMRRTIPYQDLVSTPEFYDQKVGAKELIDRFIKEGLFYAEAGPNAQRYVTVTQEALLWNWPRVRQLLDEDQASLRMRDRLEADLKLWLSRGRRSEDLLSQPGLREAKTLVRGFRTSLSDAEVDYFQKSRAAQRRSRLLRKTGMLAVIMGSALLIAVPAAKWLNAEVERRKAEALLVRQRDTLQARLKEAEAAAQEARRNAEQTAVQRDALQAQLKETEAKTQQAQRTAELAVIQRDAVEERLTVTENEARAEREQGIAGPAAAQPQADANRLPNGEAAQKSADFSVDRPKSEQSQPPNAGVKPQKTASTQPLDSSGDRTQTTAEK